ncbi:unnamed protein product [Caenorhabditis bovis]|uniref:Uncharacterized protein n=1 Tax=Caenorhabditis bovis TaxID=2654633 RepID=A0A8S1EGY3_9PELO|nr:unnamed protein product [Caenorhabditis bovis]
MLEAIFQVLSLCHFDDQVVDPCILPTSMPSSISNIWNQYNLWSAIATLFVYAYTYISVYCCTFKTKSEKNLRIQKAILNTVIYGAMIFAVSSVLSAGLIAITSAVDNSSLDADTVSTYAVIPGLISYSCNFYVYYWRSNDYRNAFIRQLCCGKVLAAQESIVISVATNSNASRKRFLFSLCFD